MKIFPHSEQRATITLGEILQNEYQENQVFFSL